jgi:hypothetical protein
MGWILETYKDERDQRKHSSPFTGSTNRDDAHRRAKDELKLGEKNLWYRPYRVCKNTEVESLVEASDNATPGSICYRVPDDPPLNRTNSNDEQTWVKGCKSVTMNGVSRITEANCGDN